MSIPFKTWRLKVNYGDTIGWLYVVHTDGPFLGDIVEFPTLQSAILTSMIFPSGSTKLLEVTHGDPNEKA